MSLYAVRSHDGASWPVEYHHVKSLRQLQDQLAPQLEIHADSLILMHQQGWQLDDASLLALLAELRNEGSGELSMSRSRASSAHAVFVFAFNRDHLDADLDALEHEMHLNRSQVLPDPMLPRKPALWSLAHQRSSSRQAFDATQDARQLATAHAQSAARYLDMVRNLLDSLRFQRQSLQVAIANLERHQASKQGGAEMFTLVATPQLERYAALLDAYAQHMDLISKIKVLPSLVSNSSAHSSVIGERRIASESPSSPNVQAGPSHVRSSSAHQLPTFKERYLSIYVHKAKIDTVKDGCSKVYADLQERFGLLKEVLAGVAEGTETLLADFQADNLDDLEYCEKDSLAAKERVDAVGRAMQLLGAQDDEAFADGFAELVILETEFRERILYLVARKVDDVPKMLSRL
jgi:autophagy-related protein 11